MAILLILPLLFGDFVQKWYIPRGMAGECGRILISDTDCDGNHEFYISTYGESQKIYIYELHLPDTWEVDSFSYFWGPLVWDIGDFDLDGLCDLAIQTAVDTPPNNLISIAESPDSFSCPTQEVWRDTVGPPLVLPISAYDIDQDGLHELVKMGGDLDTAYYTDFLIYESTNNNTYSVTYTIATETSPTSTVAFGDFDQDDFNEFVMGTIDGEYSVFESPYDNTYEARILNQQLPTVNIKDCFSVPDADGDGKLEFVVKGFTANAHVHAFIFEATGDNTYEIIKSFDLFGGSNDYWGGYSDVGDVDGDNIPEIALEACQCVYLIKAAANDSFYVWDYIYGNNSGSSVRVYDIDGNGLSEVVISGNNQTRIYEYEVGITETTNASVQGLNLDIHPNPFIHALNIKFRNPTNKKVAVRIYDVDGRIVKYFNLESSIQDQESSGVWYGDDNTGKALPPGVYFVRLVMSPVGEARGYQITGKVILLR